MKSFLETYKRCLSFIKQEQLSCALTETNVLVQKLANWNIIQEFENIRREYSLLLQYFEVGAKDPSRNQLRENFLRKTLSLIDNTLHEYIALHSNSRYADSIRTCKTKKFILRDSLEKYEVIYQENIMSSIIGKKDKNYSILLEEMMDEIFTQVWTSHEWNSSTAKTAETYILNNSSHEQMQLLLVSAISLASIFIFDIEKVKILLDCYTSKKYKISNRAFVGIVLISLMHQEHLALYPKVRDSILQLGKDSNTKKTLSAIQKQLLNIKNIDSFKKVLNNNIMASMVPEKDSEFNVTLIQDIINDDISEELVNNPRIEKLKNNISEIIEMQTEGIDLPYYTFCHLKNFPFFHKVSHWFLPFSTSYCQQDSTKTEETKFFDSIINSNKLCDSDKYSLYFFLQNMPSSEMKKTINSIKQELGEEDLDNVYIEKNDNSDYIIHYLQICFRFFNIFPQKGLIPINPFIKNLYIFENNTLAPLLHDKENLTSLTRYAHKYKMHNDVIRIFEYLDNNYNLDEESLQIYGYNLLKEGLYESALLCLEKVAIINPNSTWTLKYLGYCYIKTNDILKALNTYSKLVHLTPEDTDAILRYGECLYIEKKYEKAIKQFHKVAFLDSNSSKALRGIAYCSLLNMEANEADKYYDKLNSNNFQKDDYLHAGHAAWVIGNIEKAVMHYKHSKGESMFSFTNKEASLLYMYGITKDDMMLMQDAINKE